MAQAALPADAPLELAVFSADSDQVAHPLARGATLVVGRAPECAIRLDDPSVSRRHAVLHVSDRVEVEDLGGPNGVTVREAGVQPVVGEETYELVTVRGRTVPVGVGALVSFGSVMTAVRTARRREVERARIVVSDPAMLAVYEQADRAARGNISVLVLGETGVGKELIAERVHARSPRASMPFVALNCAALSESLLESELFGHEKGAFTGAINARPGLFEAAEGGTVFLDEIGDMPMTTQVKLLRVLEERKVMRVGARAARSVDVRFVAATNRDIESEAEAGSFRQDLFFRLNGIALTIPPLRERTSEIAALAGYFIAGAAAQLARAVSPGLSTEALTLLLKWRWPGNIRELRNVIDRAVLLCVDTTLLPEHLPPKLREPPSPPLAAPSSQSPRVRLRDEMDTLERNRILEALTRSSGNQTLAAELLGMSRRTLVTRLAEYDLPRPRKR